MAGRGAVATTVSEQLAEIRRVATRVAEGLGVEVVDLTLKGPRGRQLLRVDIDRAGPRGVDVDDCQRVSQELSAALDAADIIPTAYVLEVSSPGVDRPLTSPEDFRRSTGRPIELKTKGPDREIHEVEGRLVEYREGHVVLEQKDGTRLQVEMAQIVAAHQALGF
jgi:ribosome maturation factor RimP